MAENGKSALKRLEEAAGRGEPYDLAILDMQMPGMDGMQLARAIKGRPDLAPTRLILLTSLGARGDGAEAREAGVGAYLTKPVRQPQLFDAIASVMGSPEGEREKRLPVTRHRTSEPRTASRARVLVAEDNPVNQKVAVRMLERLGYRADVVANGLEALEALTRVPYAAVLMDVQMPEMDGYEATKEIREHEAAGRRTPIIAMTANAMRGDREKAIEAGMDDYLAKPVRQEELGAVLERRLRGERTRAPASANGDGPATSEGLAGILDPAALENLRDLGGEEMLSELKQVFLEDTNSAVEALATATESGDAGSVARISHTLKGSSGNMGASRLAAICADLQEGGDAGDLSRAPELLETLRAEFGRVRRALETQTGGEV